MSNLEPFVVDPYDYDKHKEFERAKKYIEKFLSRNRLSRPSDIKTVKYKGRGIETYGHYDFDANEICVNITRSRVPVKKPGYAWSYTGYKADLTAPGILAHETGHHVHCVLESHGGASQKEILKGIRKASKGEKRISSYEPNAYEIFAEAMRVFILNPELLHEACPARYEYITCDLGIRAPHEEDWQDVLANADPKLIRAAKSWIRRRK